MSGLELRVGQGIDLHRFASGRALILGGTAVPFEMGLAGHSDADVLTHAVIDALLGAAGMPDIGTLFPDSDARWKGADSMQLLKLAWDRIAALGWRVVNLDASIIAEKPRVAPYIPAMRSRLAGALGIEAPCCGIKATTPEGMGALGRAEGMLASCVVLLKRADES